MEILKKFLKQCNKYICIMTILSLTAYLTMVGIFVVSYISMMHYAQ